MSRVPSIPRLGLLFALAALLSGFTILRGIAPHDEGLMLQAGSRIASGQWPYRDFWTNYPPGQEVVLAGLHGLFGPSLLAWRVVRVLTDASVALLVFGLVRRRSGEKLALLAWLAAAGAMAWPTGPGPNPPALALALAALLACPARPRLAGALAGLAVVFRFELGIAAITGVLLALPAGSRRRALTVAVPAALVPLAPFVLAAGGTMWDDTFGFLGIQGLQRLPFPLGYHGPPKPDKLLEFYLPLVLVAAAALWAVAGGLRRRNLALAPLMLVSVAYLIGRTDEFHLVPLSVCVAVGLALAAPETHRMLRPVLIALLGLIALHGLDRRAEDLIHPPTTAPVPGPAADGVQTASVDARALAALRAEVNRLIPSGAPIFVADPRHDRVTAGDPLLYLILGHPNPTRYDVMQPGVVTTAPVQREIAAALQRTHTRVVIRWLDPRAEATEPNGSARSSGVHWLDQQLSRRYGEVARYGVYEVLEARR